MYLKLPGVRVRVTFLFAAFMALALHSGRALPFGTVFFSALLHECAHLAFLLSYGCRGLTLTLLPGGAGLGGAALSRLSYRHTLVCALAGPAVNLLLAAALFLCARAFPKPALAYAARVNLALGCGNLLPLSFLDGGRALAAFFALKIKSPVPFAGTDKIDLAVSVLLCALTAALYIAGQKPLFLLLFTAYCLATMLKDQCLRRQK